MERFVGLLVSALRDGYKELKEISETFEGQAHEYPRVFLRQMYHQLDSLGVGLRIFVLSKMSYEHFSVWFLKPFENDSIAKN